MSAPLTDLEAEGFIPRAQRCIGVKYGEAAMLCRMVRVGCAHACTKCIPLTHVGRGCN